MKHAAIALGLASVFIATFALAQGAADKRRSGYQDMGPALQKMQDDDTANPGMLFVQLGEQLWSEAGRRRQQSPAPTAMATPPSA